MLKKTLKTPFHYTVFIIYNALCNVCWGNKHWQNFRFFMGYKHTTSKLLTKIKYKKNNWRIDFLDNIEKHAKSHDNFSCFKIVSISRLYQEYFCPTFSCEYIAQYIGGIYYLWQKWCLLKHRWCPCISYRLICILRMQFLSIQGDCNNSWPNIRISNPPIDE